MLSWNAACLEQCSVCMLSCQYHPTELKHPSTLLSDTNDHEKFCWLSISWFACLAYHIRRSTICTISPPVSICCLYWACFHLLYSWYCETIRHHHRNTLCDGNAAMQYGMNSLATKLLLIRIFKNLSWYYVYSAAYAHNIINFTSFNMGRLQ